MTLAVPADPVGIVPASPIGCAYARVWVLGGAASGKSTFARQYAALTDARHVELDQLYWMENWTPKADAELSAELSVLLREPRWVVDGQYPVAVDRFIGTADCIVWLDPPLRVSWPRLLRRTLTRWVRRQELWAGNRESFASVFGPRSILWYALRMRAPQRTANERTFRLPELSSKALIRSRTADVRELARRVRAEAKADDLLG